MSDNPPARDFHNLYSVGPDCWEWRGTLFSNGYGRFRGEGAHRVSFRLAHGHVPAGRYICHRCDNPKCVRPEHLFVGTPRDNVQDMIRKGRNAPPRMKGERNGCAKLSACHVEQIRQRYADGGTSYRKLGAEFGVSNTAIGQIITGRKWQP